MPKLPVSAGWNHAHKKVHTHCSYCALQCGMTYTVDLPSNKVVLMRGRRDFPTTRGLSCIKGQTAHFQLDHPERLTQPLVRSSVTEAWREASWEEALDFAASRFAAVRDQHGPHANAVFGSGALTNENAYLLGKFARLALKTKNIDYNGRYCMSSAAAAQNQVFGLDRGLHFPLADLQKSRCILLVGANIAECLPPMLTMLAKAKVAGARIILADPRPTDAKVIADLQLCGRPGTDLALANALLHQIQADGGLDDGYIRDRTRGMEDVLGSVRDCTPEWAEEITGIPAGKILQAARWLQDHKPSLILTGRGAEQHAKGPQTVMAFINVALGLGQVGLPGAGFGTLTGQGNGQGGREQGQKADQLPGYRLIEDPRDRQAVAAAWGVEESEIPGKGLTAQELFQASNRREVRALWVVASNPAVSAAKGREVSETLAGLDFLAVSDLFLSETCRHAHVVFPATAFAEEDGTMTNIEGRVVLRRAAVKPPGKARPDWQVMCALARRLGAQRHFDMPSAEAVFTELALVSAGARADYSGLSYGKLERHKGVFWPCPTVGHIGTPRLFQKTFQHPDGLAHPRPTSWLESPEGSDPQYPLRLTTGRVLHHYLSGNQTRRIPVLNKKAPRPFVQIGFGLALRLGLKEGQSARLRTRRGEMVLPVKVLPGQDDGTLFVPMHFGGEDSINNLTQDALSPLSKMPEFKNCAASLSPLT